MAAADAQAQQEKALTALKNTSLDLQGQLATLASEKKQLELRLQANQTTLTEAQQLAQARVVEASSDRSVRAKAVDELQTVKSSFQKLKERQEALTSAANAQGGSAADVAIREERAKLLVSMVQEVCARLPKTRPVQFKFAPRALARAIGSRLLTGYRHVVVAV